MIMINIIQILQMITDMIKPSQNPSEFTHDIYEFSHSRHLRIFALTTFTNFRTYCILLRTLLNSLKTFTNLRSILLSMFITKKQCVIQNTPPVIYYLVYLALKDTKDYYIIFLLNPSFSIHCLNGEFSNICMRHFWSMPSLQERHLRRAYHPPSREGHIVES